MSRYLYLLRHSLTEANEKRLYCGATDLPLSAEGIKKIDQHLAEGIYPPGEGLTFVTSGRLRAAQTLQRIYGDIPFKTLAELDEFHFGRFEMHSYEELKTDPDYLRWIEDETQSVPCPGGESTLLFRARVLKGLETLLAMPEERLLVVCHGGVISNIMSHLFPGEDRHFYAWQPQPARGFAIELSGNRPARYESI